MFNLPRLSSRLAASMFDVECSMFSVCRRALCGAIIGILPAATLAAAASAPSAFLAEHANSHVKWESWGAAAFQRAKAENRPIYLHVGFFNSELSRAMDRQSFANADTAKYLNDNFVCVLVDRDREPDVAALYRAYLHDAKQLDGWPLNIWLTPELKPIEGATYLPPSEEWGKPGLNNVAKQVAGAWQADANAQKQKANDTANAVIAAEKSAAPAAADEAARKQAMSDNFEAWKGKFDATNGGFGDPPKRLEPELLRFLLNDAATRDMALTTLRAMADGAVRDPLDGGFFRQATDAAWRLPYLQKTASDQARVALAYLDAAKLDSDPRFPDAARGALRFALSELRDGSHGFIGGEDVSGEAQAFYFWTVADMGAALGSDEGTRMAKALGVDAKGNLADDAYSGVVTAQKNLPYRAEPYNAATDAADAKLRAKLLAARSARGALHRDTIAPAAVQGALLQALSRAATQLKDDSLRAGANETFAYVRAQLVSAEGALHRVAGASTAAAADDYAAVIAGLQEYAALSADKSAAALRSSLQQRFDRDYFDATAGRYFATPATDAFWVRVHQPAPAAGEPASPETIMLLTLRAQQAPADQLAVRENALVAEAKDSPEAARGDLLLALMRGI